MEVLGILFDVKEVLKGGFSGPDKNVFFPDGHVGESTVEVDRFIPSQLGDRLVLRLYRQ